jgi:hypothetical protein
MGLAAGLLLGGLVAVLLVVLVVLARDRAAARRDREALAAELARSQARLGALDERVTELTGAVAAARASAEEARRSSGYVITALAPRDEPAPALTPGRAVEERVVDLLARDARPSSRHDRMVAVAVRTIAFGHGLRHTLSGEVLDRAAAEAHVARRRSRRERRRDEREARRLVRQVRRSAAA